MTETCIDRIAKERNCEPALVRSIVEDFLAATHEASFKRGIGQALVNAHWDLSAPGAWHFLGVLRLAAESEPGELIEHYQRMDPRLARFRTTEDRWQAELDAERADRK